MVEKSGDFEGSLDKLFAGMDLTVTEGFEPVFRCDCDRARLEAILESLGEKELREMLEEDGGAEITCRFCNSAYKFDLSDLEKIIRRCAATGAAADVE